jgi:response regulator RpfG family c-di-GMP phosphodiesterase
MDQASSGPQPQNTELKPAARPSSVLVVDDDSRVLELLQITLGGRGYRVLTAHDGEEAIEVARTQNPDILVLDVRLPRKNGFEVCEALRKDEHFKNLPILMMSGNAATDSRVQGLRAGADDYLVKPFSPRELLLKIQRILERNHDREVLALKTEVLEEELDRQRVRAKSLRDDYQGRLARLGSVLDRIQEVCGKQTFQEVLDRFVLTAVGVLDFQSVALLILEKEQFDVVVQRGIRLRNPKALRINASSEMAGVLAVTEHAVATEDLALRPGCHHEVGLLSAAGLLWSIGIHGDGSLKGILCVGDRSDHQPLDRFDLRLVEALAGSVATSLANLVALDRTQDSYFHTIMTLLTAFESRNPWLVGHSERVREWCVRLARAAGLDDSQIGRIETAAMMHNLGAVERHEDLLRAAVVLSPAERMKRQREASQAVGQLRATGMGEGVIEILRHQAEYWEGSGVPDGLSGEDIPLGSRVLAIANAYDALVHDRAHRRAYSHEQALELIRERAGTQFDPDLVETFLQCQEASEIGRG